MSITLGIDIGTSGTKTLAIDERAESGPPKTRANGIRVEQTEHEIRVQHPSLEFRLADNLDGLIQAILVRGDSYLVAGSAGVVLAI